VKCRLYPSLFFFSFLLIFLFPFIFIFSLFLSFSFLPLPYFPLPSRKPHEVALADLPPASSVPVAGLHSPRTAPPLRRIRSSRRPFFLTVPPTPPAPARMRRPSSALPLAVHHLSGGVHLRRPPSVSTPRARAVVRRRHASQRPLCSLRGANQALGPCASRRSGGAGFLCFASLKTLQKVGFATASAQELFWRGVW
jgi:hypothetical protein